MSVCHHVRVPSVSLAAAILAGGRARRMDGLDKSRLVVEGRAIIVRQLDALRRLTPQVFVVSSDAERFADLGVPLVPDALPGTGRSEEHTSELQSLAYLVCR